MPVFSLIGERLVGRWQHCNDFVTRHRCEDSVSARIVDDIVDEIVTCGRALNVEQNNAVKHSRELQPRNNQL